MSLGIIADEKREREKFVALDLVHGKTLFA